MAQRKTGAYGLMRGLKGRTLAVTGATYGVITALALAALWLEGERVARDLGSAYAERVVLWHKQKTAAVLTPALTLLRTLAENPAVQAWARDEQAPGPRRRALAAVRRYHAQLDPDRYATLNISLAGSRHWYVDKADGAAVDATPDDTLKRDNRHDGWFFHMLKADAPFHVNVGYSRTLETTKLWVNVPVDPQGEALGLVGTGVDLSHVIEQLARLNHPGMTGMLVNREGVIQAHPDRDMIAFNAPLGRHTDRTLYRRVDTPDGRERLRHALDALAEEADKRTAMVPVTIDDSPRLLAAAWMPRLDLYSVAALDLGAVLGWQPFLAAAAVLAAALTGSLVLVTVMINRLVVRPVRAMVPAAERLAEGDYSVRLPVDRDDEIGVLHRTFNGMTERLQATTEHLESEVEARTRELATARDEAEDALARMERAQNELVEAEKQASLGRLVAGVAHEVNTPVGITLTSASYLEEETARLKQRFDARELRAEDLSAYLAEMAEVGELITRNAGRAAELIQSFKQVAVDQSSAERRIVDLAHYLDEVVTSLRPRLHEVNASITLDSREGLFLDTYPGALSQVVTNLVDNAAAHAFGPGEAPAIHVSVTAAEDGGAVLRVADTGRGIADADKSRVFEPFFTTARGAGGSGLGLAIVHNLVRGTLGGRIQVVDNAPQGTVFVVTLPEGPPEGTAPAHSH